MMLPLELEQFRGEGKARIFWGKRKVTELLLTLVIIEKENGKFITYFSIFFLFLFYIKTEKNIMRINYYIEFVN